MASAYGWYFHNQPVAFPWTQERCQAIAQRRAKLQGSLFLDKLLTFAQIDALAHYPPHDDLSLDQLLSLIQDSPFDDLKKNCLVYYLLRTYDDGREDQFAQNVLIPTEFIMLSDAYYCLDWDQLEDAVFALCDIRVVPDFVSKIIHSLANSDDPQQASTLVLKYIRVGKPVLTDIKDLEIYMTALCHSRLLDAWLFQRTFPEEAHPSGRRMRLLRKILDFCLHPRPRPEPLKALVSFPFTTFEDTHVINYALSPPTYLSDISIAVLHDLINVRLIHQGRYSEAIRLDRQFSSKFVGDVNGGGVIVKAAESRRISMAEVVAVLPAVQRRLLEVELGPAVSPTKPATISASNSTDLSMSWERMEDSTSSLGKSGVLVNPNQASTILPPQSSAPISATPAFRHANPQVAVLQAFAQASSRLEGSLSPSSRPSTANATSGFASSKRLPPAKQAPFGMTPQKSALSASIMASSSTPQKALLSQPSNNSFHSNSPFGFSASNAQKSTAASSYYRPAQPPQPDDSFLGNGNGNTNGSSQLRMKRSYGQVAKSPRTSGNFDTMDLDELGGPDEEAGDEESDDNDDMVINTRRIDPRVLLAMSNGQWKQDDEDEENEEHVAPPPPPPPKSRSKAGPRSRVTGKAEKEKEVDKPTKEIGKKGFPGAFPAGYEDYEEEIRDHDQEHLGVPSSRRSARKQSHQSDGERSSVSVGGRTPPPTKTRSATKPSRIPSAATKKPSTTSASRTATTSRTTRVTKGTSPLPPQDEDEEGGSKSTVRRSSRLTITSGGSPERKKQRSSAEPEPQKKAGRRAGSSTLKTQAQPQPPSRIMTRRQQSLLEE